MLCIANKAIYNQFKGLAFMVSASPSATRGASLEETAALLGQHRERSQLEYREQCHHAIMVSCS